MLLFTTLASGCAAGALPAQTGIGSDGRCQLRVILDVRPGAGAPAAIEPRASAQAAGERLRYLRAMTAQRAVYELSAPGGPEACRAALERLRADPRLRSAEPDQVRRAHD